MLFIVVELFDSGKFQNVFFSVLWRDVDLKIKHLRIKTFTRLS